MLEYKPSKEIIANVEFHGPVLHFQGQPFVCYTLAILIEQAADVPGRFASTHTDIAVELLLLYHSVIQQGKQAQEKYSMMVRAYDVA